VDGTLAVQAGGRRDREEGTASTAHPRQPAEYRDRRLTSFNAGGMIGTVNIKGKGAHAVRGAGAVQERQVRACRAEQEGHVQLQQV